MGELLEFATASPRSSFKHDPAAGPQPALKALSFKAPAVTAPPLTEEVTSEQQATKEVTSEQQPTEEITSEQQPTEEITSVQRAPSKLEVAAVLEEDSTQVEP